ncbi:MAG: hypothetical protein M3019_03030 [Candidatus Dormibacteraeota bacterium]|nr:hypothetical protein [Candidatus Dormibacteraeota bacterium]MDQ6949145.1 hypothetical protein [Actinomycetota bacterium]
MADLNSVFQDDDERELVTSLLRDELPSDVAANPLVRSRLESLNDLIRGLVRLGLREVRRAEVARQYHVAAGLLAEVVTEADIRAMHGAATRAFASETGSRALTTVQ